MAKCPLCESTALGPDGKRGRDGELAWQPFGPGDVLTVTRAGSHYRGFPVVKICSFCAGDLDKGRGFRRGFTFRGLSFVVDTFHMPTVQQVLG